MPEMKSLTLDGITYDSFVDKTARIGKTVTPERYGAKGDGSTDDTAAFQTALAENRVVFIPGGTYVLSGTLVIRENCCLELSQDTVLKFDLEQDKLGINCIEMRGSATLRGNHAIISVPYAFTGNVICMDTLLDSPEGATSTDHHALSIPPYTKSSPQFKRQRFIYDVNIIKPMDNYGKIGFCQSADGNCNGTAIYMSATNVSNTIVDIPWMWAINMSGIRIAGGFSYGIHAINYDSDAGSSGHYEDDAWNHDMRIEAVIEACEIGVALENCNGAHLNVTIQPTTAKNNGAKYAKHGVYIKDSRFVDMMRSRIWDWDANRTLWTYDADNQNQHIALIGNCRGLLLDDYYVHERPNVDIRTLIYTDTPSNFDTMTILQEPANKWFKPISGEPFFDGGNGEKRLLLQEEFNDCFQTDYVPQFTNALDAAGLEAGALTGSGSVDTSTVNYYKNTGFIPCKKGDTLYFKNFAFNKVTSDDGYVKCFLYDANFALLAQVGLHAILSGSSYYIFTGEATEDGGILRVEDQPNAAYARFGFKNEYIGEDPVISVNKPIEYVQDGFLDDGIKVKAANIVGNTVLTSPSGKKFVLSVSDDGQITATQTT